jgi:hypothetical protein
MHTGISRLSLTAVLPKTVHQGRLRRFIPKPYELSEIGDLLKEMIAP